jgi:Fe(3+) dicitrate transport protein
MLRFFKPFLFFLLISANYNAQIESCSLTGSLIDSSSNTPISGAYVYWFRGNKIIQYTITDDIGLFELKNIKSGIQNIRVRHLGYDELNIDFRISSGENELQLSLSQSHISLPTVKVIGVRPSDFSNLPGAANKLSEKDLEKIAPIGTQEALEYVPGINGFADDGIGNSRINIGIRGINPRRTSRTLVLEDGIPIQPALYVYSSMYYNPPIERVGEIEVIKGSSSIQYGPQTMGGVINYVTHRPREEFGGRVSLTAGANRYLSSLLEIGGFGGKKFRPEIQLLYKSGDGYRDNNEFEQYNGTYKMMFLPSDKRRIYVNINANYEKSNATYTGLTEYSFATNPRFNPKNNDEFTVQRYGLNIIQQRELKSNWEENTKVYFNYFDRDWWREHDMFASASDYEDGSYNEIPLAETANVTDLIRVGNGQTNFGILRTFMVAGVEHQYLWKHNIGDSVKGSLNLGARVHFERFIDNAGTGDAPDARSGTYYRANNYETYAYSFFAREEFDFGDFKLSPGFRIECFEQEMVNRLNGNQLNDATTLTFLPGLGFNYKLKSSNFFGGIHRGMTPPSNGTLLMLNFGETDDSSFEDLQLKSETSVNYELGFRTTNKYINAEVVGFYMRIHDMIAAARGTAFTNLGMVTSMGAESAVKLKLSKANEWLPDLFCNYTYLMTEVYDGVLTASAINDTIVPDVSGNELPYAPNHNLILGLNYSIKGIVDLMFNYRYISKSFSDYENIDYAFNRGDTGPIPAYWLFNASLNVHIKNKFRAFITAKNIFDKQYIGSRLHSNPGQKFASSSSGIMPGAGRQINLGISYNF